MDYSEKEKAVTKFQAWVLASRPKTLPAAASPVIIASAIAFYEKSFHPWVALTALFGALLLQIGANLANDVFDYKRGVDDSHRLGPLRVTQAGLLTPREVLTGMGLVFFLAAVCGLYMLIMSGWWILLIGVLAILAAIGYTGGPFPYGYRGFGELFVLLFFGFAAVCGTYYAQAGRVSPLAIFSSIPVGLLIVSILIVNNLRDIEGDKTSGKLTLAVRYGANWAKQEFIAVIAFAYLVVFLLGISAVAPAWILISWLSLPMIFRLTHSILHDRGRALNQTLAATGQLTLFFAILYALGLVLAYFYPL